MAFANIPTVGTFLPGYEASFSHWNRGAKEHARRYR